MAKPPLKRQMPDGFGGVTKGTRKGNGAGWGGAASGRQARAAKGDKTPFETGNEMAVAHGQRDLTKAERIARLQDNLEHLALHAEAESVRMQASNHLLNRLDGMPISRNVNVNAGNVKDLSDEALLEIISGAEAEVSVH